MILSRFIRNYTPKPQNWSRLGRDSWRIIHDAPLPSFSIGQIRLINGWVPTDIDVVKPFGKESEKRTIIMRWHLSLNYFRKLHYYKNISVLHCGYAEYFAKYPKKIPKNWDENIPFGGMIAFPGTIYCSWNQMMPMVRVLERSIYNGKWSVAYTNLYWPFHLKNSPMAVFETK